MVEVEGEGGIARGAVGGRPLIGERGRGKGGLKRRAEGQVAPRVGEAVRGRGVKKSRGLNRVTSSCRPPGGRQANLIPTPYTLDPRPLNSEP